MSGSDRTICGSQRIPEGKAVERDLEDWDFAAWNEEGKAFEVGKDRTCKDAEPGTRITYFYPFGR